MTHNANFHRWNQGQSKTEIPARNDLLTDRGCTNCIHRAMKMESFHEALQEPLVVADTRTASQTETTSLISETGYEPNASSEPSFFERLRRRRDGDWSRTLMQLAYLIFTILTITFVFLTRSSDWVKTYLVVTPLVSPDNGAEVSSTTTLVYETDFKGARHWFKECDANAIFKQMALFVLNIYPIVKSVGSVVNLIALAYGPSSLPKSTNSVAKIRPQYLESVVSDRANVNSQTRGRFEILMGKLYSGIDYLNFFFKVGVVSKVSSVAFYMQIMLLIAASPTFMKSGYEYSFENSSQEGLYLFHFATLTSLVSALIVRVQDYRWKRRLLVTQRYIAMRENNDRGNNDVNDITEEQQQGTTSETRNIIQKWRNLSVEDKTTVYLVLAMISRVIVFFTPILKYEYSGKSAMYLEDTSETFTLYEIIFEFKDRAFSGADGFWIPTFLIFDLIVMPSVLLLATMLVKVIHSLDINSLWIPPLFYFISYGNIFANLESIVVALMLTVATLEYVVRVLVEYSDDLCFDDETDTYCYIVKPRFQAGTWILVFHFMMYSFSVGGTQSYLSETMKDSLAKYSYGNVMSEIDHQRRDERYIEEGQSS